MKCKNCGLPIAKIIDPWGYDNYRGTPYGYYHTTLEREANIDGADVPVYATFCPDDLGEAEPEDVEAKLADLSDEAIKAMDLYWEPDLERIRFYLAAAYERGAQAVRQ